MNVHRDTVDEQWTAQASQAALTAPSMEFAPCGMYVVGNNISILFQPVATFNAVRDHDALRDEITRHIYIASLLS